MDVLMRLFFYTMIITTLFTGCATVNKVTEPLPHNAARAYPGTFSMYGRSIQYDEDKKMHYADVFVGGGANHLGAEAYAKDEIEKFQKEQGFKTYTISNSEYSFFPLSKFRVFIQYEK
ncbi:hypothetical protein [Sulfuricurvum kujiense]|nr:hypothetical protein [Sulfuricurvum kujiense]